MGLQYHHQSQGIHSIVVASLLLATIILATHSNAESGPSEDSCTAELAEKDQVGNECECPEENVTVCNYNCTLESGGKIITNGCQNGTVVEACIRTCPAIMPTSAEESVSQYTGHVMYMDSVKPATCQNVNPCSSCQPGCQTGYYWHGSPLECTASSNWTGSGGCRYLGVHRVGVGIFALNVGDIKLQDGSFHIDFMMTIRTEEYAFETAADALATFKGGPRDCSPWRNETRSTGSPSMGLGTGALNTQAQEPNSAPYLSPTQYVLAQQQSAKMDDIATVENLGISFLTLAKPTITRVTFQSGDPQVSPISYRVQGTGYFRPALQNWPFDTQRLEVLLEDLDLTISANKVSFVFCSLGNYTGLSPTVRFPEAGKQLSIGVEITEMCWPPFYVPYEHESNPSNTGPISQSAGAAETCALHGGEFRSSRYNFFIEYRSPSLQRFIKTYLPVCMINFILSMSYVLPVKDYSQRITICVGTLTALVLFHVSLETQLPSSESVTLADWLMIYSYAMNLLTWAVTITLMLLHHADHDWTLHLQRVVRCCGPITVVLVTIVCCSFRASDYTHGRAEGKLFGTVVGSLALGWIIHTAERIVGRTWSSSRRRTPPPRRHPTNSIRMEVLGGARRRRDFDDQDGVEEALLKDKDHHVD